jgi:hypothetical protein
MKCDKSLLFLERIKRITRDNFPSVKIITGLSQGEELFHETIEAQLWLSDVVFVILPYKCLNFDGDKIKDHEWVAKELVLSKTFNKRVYVIREKQSKFQIEEIIDAIEDCSLQMIKSFKSSKQDETAHLKKLKRCKDDLITDVRFRTWIEYTPSKNIDDEIIPQIRSKINVISKDKCENVTKMIRLWFRREDWEFFRHIHKLTRNGNPVNIDEIIKSIKVDGIFKDKNESWIKQTMLRRLKIFEDTLNIKGQIKSILKIENDMYKSEFHTVIPAFLDGIEIPKDIKSIIDSNIEKIKVTA